MNVLSENKARSKRNEQFAQRRIVRFSFFRLRGLSKYNAIHCEQSGTALTPGGRCLRALRMRSVASNICRTKVYVARLFNAAPTFVIAKKQVTNHYRSLTCRICSKNCDDRSIVLRYRSSPTQFRFSSGSRLWSNNIRTFPPLLFGHSA